MRSINQMAQEDGDTSANEANRIREREAAVRTAWREHAFAYGEGAVTAAGLALATGLPEPYVRLVCERSGYGLV